MCANTNKWTPTTRLKIKVSTNYFLANNIYIYIYICKLDLILHKPQGFICHKKLNTKPLLLLLSLSLLLLLFLLLLLLLLFSMRIFTLIPALWLSLDSEWPLITLSFQYTSFSPRKYIIILFILCSHGKLIFYRRIDFLSMIFGFDNFFLQLSHTLLFEQFSLFVGLRICVDTFCESGVFFLDVSNRLFCLIVTKDCYVGDC